MADYDDIFEINNELAALANQAEPLSKTLRKLDTIYDKVKQKIAKLKVSIVELSIELYNAKKENTQRFNVTKPGEFIPGKGHFEGGRGKDLTSSKKYEENQEIYFEASNIIWEQMQRAAKSGGGEYDHPYFLDRLKAVAYNPDLITITKVGKMFYVDLKMNEIAGSLEEYAQGVKAAREKFKVKAPHKMTSWFWQEKYYGQAREGRPLPAMKKRGKVSVEEKREKLINRYWETIQFRLDSSGKVAPFWELLDQGSIPMSSDRGEEPYPKGNTTNFVRTSILLIRSLLMGTLVEAPGRYSEDEGYYINVAEETQYNIDKVKEVIKSYETVLAEISVQVDRVNNDIRPEVFAEVRERLEKYKERIDPNVLDLIQAALDSGDLSSLDIKSGYRINVSVKGQKPYRPRIKRAANLLGLVQ